MTSIPKLKRGIDFSAANITPADVKGKFHFVCHYSAGAGNNDSRTQWKLTDVGEIQEFAKIGVDFIAISEWYAGRVTEGAAAGTEDGATDLKFWKERGLAKGAGIVPSWDEGQPNVGLHAQLAAYLRAYAKALGGYYVVGLYAGDVAIRSMLRQGVIKFGVRAEAESWSADGAGWYQPGDQWPKAAREVANVSPAAIWQDGDHGESGNVDIDVTLLPFEYGHLSVGGDTGGGGGGGKHHKPKPPLKTKTYVVKHRDTLSGIARKYGTSVRVLIRLNRSKHPSLGANPDLIRAGWELLVPAVTVKKQPKTYTVESGDRLWDIAKKYGTTVTQLVAWNHDRYHSLLTHPDKIFPGWELRVS